MMTLADLNNQNQARDQESRSLLQNRPQNNNRQ